ncbi:MAG TPA: AmmeMemoRadiSam system radical SAM enzyme [Bacteroidales bacterium]|nr:AmmeMemoRadiSam system radical SAM enzyme [Bacteroidales bacterium]
MKEARYYNTTGDNTVQCYLCPHNCIIKPENRGQCRVRKNINGILYSENYEQVCSIGFDPIEKKPFYHYFPGKIIFSVGSIGCNLHCKFCQNWGISQSNCEEFEQLHSASPDQVINLALSRHENIGIAFTYNEPAVWYEYMMDIARLSEQELGLRNVMVSNGYINQEPLEDLFPYIDAFSIDLKAFTDVFYHEVTGTRLQPVLDTLKRIRAAGKHLEITNLLITNRNDDPDRFKEMVGWIESELGRDTVLHISRYFPAYKLDEPKTPEETLYKFYEIASSKLNYVYLGNLRSNHGQDTYCPECKTKVIKRSGYNTEIVGLKKNGHCSLCDHKIIQYI